MMKLLCQAATTIFQDPSFDTLSTEPIVEPPYGICVGAQVWKRILIEYRRSNQENREKS
jgi:hypothetical protein